MSTLRLDRDTTALLLVDVQPDFMPGGALPVPAGDEIIGPIGQVLERELFAHVAATQDWHPPGHVSFASSHPDHDPMDVIRLYGEEQILWPDHCIQGTPGAALHPELDWRPAQVIVRKGMEPDSDSYSGFRNNWNAAHQRPTTGLAGYLRERGIARLYVAGLARDVCVRWTALDAAAAGFDTTVIWDLTRGVEPDADPRIRREFRERGIAIVQAAELPGFQTT